ncbi:MAG: XrtA-associated ATPase [Rhodospirillales bacterium]|nr:XrtA-associated ATPase [Rhodospirillales bacterium]
MYVDFFKFKAAPFQLTPDPRFFFGSSVHTRAKAYLTYGLDQKEGFIIITGDVGAGKTTLVGHLLSTLDATRHVAAKIVTTHLDAENTLRMVASAFGLEQEDADKATLLSRIESFLLAQHKEGRRALLVVDEAQNLSFETLEELRMLSNFQMEEVSLLQIFLLGQPQFRRTLASPDLDQFRQRIIASYHLGPVNAEETQEYVKHRLRAVGWANDPEITDAAFEEIYKFSGGVPRRINLLCSRLLLFGFLEEVHHLDRDSVMQVAEDLKEETEQVLDHKSDDMVSKLQTTLSAGLRSADVSDIKKRLDNLEADVEHHDFAFRKALVMLFEYLSLVNGETKKKDNA